MTATAAALGTQVVTVTADNFNRTETDKYFADSVKRGALGKFIHFRALPTVEEAKASVRPHRDTLYSHAVFDLDAGPVTTTKTAISLTMRSSVTPAVTETSSSWGPTGR